MVCYRCRDDAGEQFLILLPLVVTLAEQCELPRRQTPKLVIRQPQMEARR